MLLFLKSVKPSTPIEYLRISLPTSIFFGTDSSNWLCPGSLCFGGKRSNVRSVLKLGRLGFHAPWARRGLSNPSAFLLPRSMTAFNLFQPSWRPLSRLCLRERAAGGSPKLNRTGLDYRRHSKRREMAKVIAGRFLFFRFLSVVICWSARECVDNTPTRRLKRSFARAGNVPHLPQRLWENRPIELKSAAFTDSKKVCVRVIETDIVFSTVSFLAGNAFV